MKPLIDQMEDLKDRLQQYKPPHKSRSRLNWKAARNKRRYCKFGDECNRQNHDGPDCFWRHGGHLKNSVLCLHLSTTRESQDRIAPRSGGVCFCNKTPTLLFCGSGPRLPLPGPASRTGFASPGGPSRGVCGALGRGVVVNCREMREFVTKCV